MWDTVHEAVDKVVELEKSVMQNEVRNIFGQMFRNCTCSDDSENGPTYSEYWDE